MKAERMELAELVRFARRYSPFYRELYAALPAEIRDVEELPVLNQAKFWEANTLGNNAVLTGPMHDGIVFKSGGTTGNPKFSVFSKVEWEGFNATFGRVIGGGGVRDGDRVANLFYVGQLYGSLLFINKSFEMSPRDVLQLPIGGTVELSEMMQIIRDFGVNVLAGVPTTIMNLAVYIEQSGEGRERFRVEKILFGGEAMYSDQRERLAEIFPGVEILSIGYASTDAGLLAYADESCGQSEHRVFDGETIFEILDEESGHPIREPGHEGLVVVTNLTRKLMPIIRYPVGDRGAWVEAEGTANRKFRLLGRSEEAAQIGLVKLYVEDVRGVLHEFRNSCGIVDFQLVVIHRDRRDGLVLKIATHVDSMQVAQRSEEIVQAIHRARPLYEEFLRDRKVHPIVIEWVSAGALEINPRTGKLKRVVDRRMEAG